MPMMQQIPVEVDHVIGVKVSGKIERQDMDAMFALPNFKKFAKKAVVSQIAWMEKWTPAVGHLFPSIKMKHFSPEQKAAALKWIQE
jgi:hypothetical protein